LDGVTIAGLTRSYKFNDLVTWYGDPVSKVVILSEEARTRGLAGNRLSRHKANSQPLSVNHWSTTEPATDGAVIRKRDALAKISFADEAILPEVTVIAEIVALPAASSSVKPGTLG
jgi:hypothetical protein